MKKGLGWIKAVGIGAGILGILATMIGDWADEKEQDAIIEEKVELALNEKLDELYYDSQETDNNYIETENVEES